MAPAITKYCPFPSNRLANSFAAALAIAVLGALPAHGGRRTVPKSNLAAVSVAQPIGAMAKVNSVIGEETKAEADAEISWDQQVEALAEGYRQRQPVRWFSQQWSGRQVEQMRDRFLAVLAQDYGVPIGYKAALVNPAVRSRFSASGPIRGIFFGNMLRPSGVPISVSAGTRMLVEGDILVRVRDAQALQRARTDDEILAALDAVIPFIEVPDLIYSADSTINAQAIATANAGARTGWVGYPVSMTAENWRSLSTVQVAMQTTVGRQSQTRTVFLEKGLGMKPAAVVRWLRDELRRSRISPKRGDILSLGTLLPPMPAQPGMEISLRYLDLGSGGGAIVFGRFSYR